MSRRSTTEEGNATPRFHFGIPLRAKRSSLNWELVCQNLSRTLLSLQYQTSSNFGILIACHEVPDVDVSGLDVEFVIAENEALPAFDIDEQATNDKPLKKRLLGMALKERLGEGGYYMQLDSDDLVHPELVRATLEDDNRRGYLIERGYMFDCSTGQAGYLDNENKPFWRHCGSCAAIYLTADDMPKTLGDKKCYFNQFKRHKEYAEMAARRDRPLDLYAAYMAVYLVNHGENDTSTYRGELSAKSEYVRRSLVTDPAQIVQLALDYPQLSEFLSMGECESHSTT